MQRIEIQIPEQPQGKGRARAGIRRSKKTGKQFISHLTPSKTRQYENHVRSYAFQAMVGREPIEGAVKLILVLTFEIPKSWPKWKKRSAAAGDLVPTAKPDIDNVVKAVCDAFNKVVWKDDDLVVNLEAQKLYGDTPGVCAIIVPVDKLSSKLKRKPVAGSAANV